MNVLIIEDEPKVASFIKRGLEENGYNAQIALDGKEGLTRAQKENFDLIVLDVNLPLMNGLAVCKEIRKTKAIPILMLTALGTLDNKVMGLDSGADDYLLKPFEFQELLARMRALTRRVGVNTHVTEIYRFEDLELDTVKKSVIRSNKRIELTAKEYFLLEYFMKNPGKVLTRSEIAEKVWNLGFDTGTNIIDVYINYLRRKIDKDFNPKLIHTLVGMGYVLKVEVSNENQR